MFKWVAGSVVSLGIMTGLTGIAQASQVYLVQSTSVVNCGLAPHGLWTGQQNFSGGTCGKYYDISGTFTLNNDDASPLNWSGSIVATAINPQGAIATVNIALSNFAENAQYKTEGGASYNGSTDTADAPDLLNGDIDFFQTISGTIDIEWAGNTTTYDVDGPAGGYSFQWGLGGNAKKADEFGGSAWLLMSQDGNPVSGHWDLNLAFESPVTSTEVSEPGMLAVFGLGLAGLGAIRRRTRKS
jgi:hypothetical protein